jgi:hypothetical protein
MRLDGCHDPLRDLVLNLKDVLQVAVIFLSPDVLPGFGVAELARDADPLCSGANAPFEDISDTEFARDLADVHHATLVNEARVACDDEKPAQAGERRDDVLAQAIRKEIPRGIAVAVSEGQDGDRRSGRWLSLHLRRDTGGRADIRGAVRTECSEREAGVTLDDRERSIRVEAGEKLVDRRLTQPRLEGELLARNPLACEIIPQDCRYPLSVVHRACKVLQAKNPESLREIQAIFIESPRKNASPQPNHPPTKRGAILSTSAVIRTAVTVVLVNTRTLKTPQG